MKHATRMVVLSEEEYIKLKNADVSTNNNNNSCSSNSCSSNSCSSCSQNCESSGVKTTRKRKTVVKGQDKSARVSDKKPVKSRKSNVNRKHQQSMSKDIKLDKKKAKAIEQQLLWTRKDVSRKIKRNILGGDIDNEHSEFIVPPVKQSISVKSYFKPEYQSIVSAILTGLKQIGVKVKNDFTVQLPYGDIIQGSNIVNLLKELVTGSVMSARRPIGWKLFLPVVAQTSTPLAMYTKAYVRDRIAKIRRDQTWEEY